MEYHQDRFEDFSLLIFKEEKLRAVLPANREGATLYSHQGLTYGGLVLDAEIRLKEVIELFKELLDYLSQSGIEELELKMLPQFYKDQKWRLQNESNSPEFDARGSHCPFDAPPVSGGR